MSASISIKSYDTPDDLYASLARVFEEKTSSGYRWIEFTHDGVSLTFFGSKVVEVADDEEQHSVQA